ncbi:MAG: hypothetical protein K2N95_12040 [Lachnospiraceae bacterium]|nr:hypothetical protein [Lachnospiraceae bacterium]
MLKKRLWFLAFALIMLLCACGQPELNSDLEFPKISWDMTPEEVLKAYGISREEAALYEEGEQEIRLRLDNVELFGQTAEHVFINFADFSGNEDLAEKKEIYKLYEIKAYYEQSSDMKAVKDKLDQAYGSTIPAYYHFMPLTLDQMREDAYKESDNAKYWGNSLLKDVIPEEHLEAYKEQWKFYQIGLNDDNWDFFKDNARMVVVIMADNEGENGKAISWNAKNLAVYHTISSQIDNK